MTIQDTKFEASEDEKRAAFERGTRELLNTSAQSLEARIRSRLTQARYAAVEEARKARGTFAWRTWIPAGGLAAAAVLAVLLWSGVTYPPSRTPVIAEARSALDDLEIVAADDSLDMIEDVEFYAWLDTESGAGPVHGVG